MMGGYIATLCAEAERGSSNGPFFCVWVFSDVHMAPFLADVTKARGSKAHAKVRKSSNEKEMMAELLASLYRLPLCISAARHRRVLFPVSQPLDSLFPIPFSS
jgi:hypothetical protein